MSSIAKMAESRLFQPLQIGNMKLSHRLVMAPLTRFRADDDHVQLPFTTTYYSQRASVPGTFLITEATLISQQAGGYANVPGIWNKAQIAAWRKVTDAVHEKGSFIYCQLWALGRVADPATSKKEGIEIKGASPVKVDENHAEPKEMTEQDIQNFVEDYAQAARNAIEAGFDGVEIHGANGYLIDQFLQENSNVRTDQYGNSVENRSRFPLAVVSAIVNAIGSSRVGIRLSPWSRFQGMGMPDDLAREQFAHFITEMKALKLAYIHVVEARISGATEAMSATEGQQKVDFAVEAWGNTSPVLVAGGFKPDTAKRAVDVEFPDRDVAVVFGRYFISTPDLPFRVQNGLDLAPYNRKTFYKAGSEEGYTDYPYSEQFQIRL